MNDELAAQDHWHAAMVFQHGHSGSVDDAERARWNVPPLAEAERRAAAMNRQSSSS